MVMMMMVVLAFTLDTNDVVAEAGGAMDTNATLKSSPEGASKGPGRSEGSEFVCWYYERESDSEHPNVVRCRGTTTWDSRRFRGWSTTKEGAGEGSSANVTSAASVVWA